MGLDPSRFDAREHAALCWVRETLTSIQGPSEDTLVRFEEAFDERHRSYVLATMKAMYFFNLLGNTAQRWLMRLLGRDEEQTEVCELVYD